MPIKKILIHQCFCRDCDLIWNSTNIESYCPICAKKIIAKIMIKREEKTTEEIENE